MNFDSILDGELSSSDSPSQSGSRSQRTQEDEENAKKREEQRKATTWMLIGWAGIIMGILVFIALMAFLVFAEKISATIATAVLVTALVAALALLFIWNVVLGIRSIPTQEAWIIEARGNFLRVATESPTLLLFPGLITRVAQRISRKEIFEKNIFENKKLRLKTTLIGLEAEVGYKVTDFYKFFYSVHAEQGKTWGKTMSDLIRATARDALQTYATTGNPAGGAHTIDTIVKTKGANLASEIFRGSSDQYEEIKENLKRWGIEITTLIFGDFEESPEDMKLKKDILAAEQKKKVAEIEIETKRIEGKAEAEKINAATWAMAKDYAGIRKEDKDLSEAETKAIAAFVPAARSDYLESLSVEGAIKSPDRMVITQGESVGKVMGRDAAREAVRLGMAKRKQKED